MRRQGHVRTELIQARVTPAEKQELQAAAAARGQTVSDLSRDAMLTLSRPTRLYPRGQLWADYQETVPAGIPLQTVMTAAYWGERAKLLRPFDVINLVADDGSYCAVIRFIGSHGDKLTFRLLQYSSSPEGEAILRESLARRFPIVAEHPPGTFSIFDNLTRAKIAAGLTDEAARQEQQRIIDREAA